MSGFAAPARTATPADACDLRRRAGHELGLRAGVREHLLRDHAGVE